MLINTKIFVQQNNIHKNRKQKVTLDYSDELIFYKLLDQNIESGKTVTITFPNEKIEKDSGLYKRIACCANGEDFFDQMVSLAKTAIDAYRNFATRNIFGLWKDNKNLTLRMLYQAYKVDYAFDNKTGTYFILLAPNGEGSDSKAWMSLA